jgi:hypothetical protein
MDRSAMDDRTAGSPPPWKRRITWGLLISLGLGLSSVVIGIGGASLRLGAVITITGAILTLAVDAHFRVAEVVEEQQRREDTLIEAHREAAAALGVLSDISDRCRKFLLDTAADWKRVESAESPLLNRILEDQQLDFRSRIHALANGEISMDRRTFMQFRSVSLHDLTSMRGTSAVNPGYWLTPQGVQYLAGQKEAIAAGLEVQRILVLPRDSIKDWFDVVRDQIDAGVSLTLIIQDEVEKDYRRFLEMDRFIVVDRGGVQGALFHSPKAAAHVFTNDQAKVRETERILDDLRAYERSPADIYPSLA